MPWGSIGFSAVPLGVIACVNPNPNVPSWMNLPAQAVQITIFRGPVSWIYQPSPQFSAAQVLTQAYAIGRALTNNQS
jgi:hypothetical protein